MQFKKTIALKDLPQTKSRPSAELRVKTGVRAGMEHDCTTASGSGCLGDDCGPIVVGSQCG